MLLKKKKGQIYLWSWQLGVKKKMQLLIQIFQKVTSN